MKFQIQVPYDLELILTGSNPNHALQNLMISKSITNISYLSRVSVQIKVPPGNHRVPIYGTREFAARHLRIAIKIRDREQKILELRADV